MKKIKMFVLARCPHCKHALSWMDELFAENPEYRALDIEKIDEDLQPDISDRYDYDLVPAYFVDERQLHSGVASKDIIRRVFDAART